MASECVYVSVVAASFFFFFFFSVVDLCLRECDCVCGENVDPAPRCTSNIVVTEAGMPVLVGVR